MKGHGLLSCQWLWVGGHFVECSSGRAKSPLRCEPRQRSMCPPPPLSTAQHAKPDPAQGRGRQPCWQWVRPHEHTTKLCELTQVTPVILVAKLGACHRGRPQPTKGGARPASIGFVLVGPPQGDRVSANGTPGTFQSLGDLVDLALASLGASFGFLMLWPPDWAC